MLLTFIRDNRAELIRMARERLRARLAPRATTEELETGVPLFLNQFCDVLAATAPEGRVPATPAINASAAAHGKESLRRGFTVAQVVQDYGDICQTVTELADQRGVAVGPNDFHLLNLCLDNAVAQAVTEYSRQRDVSRATAEVERLGFLAHELRNLISTATMAFQILEAGSVAINGNTGGLLKRSLQGLRELVDRSLAEVRLESGQHLPTRVIVAELIEELEVAASLDARSKGIDLTVVLLEYGVAVMVDRQLLASAVANLLQNAFKFTPAKGHVGLSSRREGDRVFIEVSDGCSGLPQEQIADLFKPFDRRGADKTGLGLGLAITHKSVTANGGEIRVRNLPGKGCLFTIELPIAP